MARNTKRGKCELCGEVANVGTNHGSATCPKCTHVQAALANRLQAVAKAARAMGKAEDLIKALIPAGELAVHVTADMLQEISNIVGYDGENPAELVEAVRRRALACVSCDAEDVLAEIREIVGYTYPRGDLGLPAAVREAIATKKATALDCGDCDLAGCFNELAELVDQRGASAGQVVWAVRAMAGNGVPDCAECDAANALFEIAELVDLRGASSGLIIDRVRALTANGGAECNNEELRLRDDLARACDMDQDYSHRWGSVAQGAIQTIATLEYRRDFWASKATLFKIEAGDLKSELLAKRGEIEELHSHIAIGESQLEKLRAELTLAQQARDEWEQRCVAAEESMQDMEAELCNRDNGPATNADTTYLLDVALAVIREEPVPAGKIASLIEAARRAA